MLLKSDLNITEVARQTGFSGIHVFSKTFKNLIGVSPSQFLDEMVSREQIEENISIVEHLDFTEEELKKIDEISREQA